MVCGEDCRNIANNNLSRKTLGLLGEIQPSLSDLGDRLREILVRIDEEKRRKTLESISAILFRAHHEEVSGKRTAGTCEWIWKKKQFLRWEESDSPVTVLYGNPGAGKTFLISRVVDYSIENALESEAVTFFYCKRDETNRRNPQDILRSILHQLSTPINQAGDGMIHVALEGLPDRLAANGTTFDVSTCESLIGTLIKDYSRTTIVLDALDECERDTREELMNALRNLMDGNERLRVFISSRPDDDIRRHFDGKPVIEMQATDNEDDISSFVDDRLSRDSRWADLSSQLQEEIKKVLHEKSAGMFQWAALQVDQIRRLKLWSETNIRKQVEISPAGLKGAYDVVWNQIQEMSSQEEQLATRALQWVLCSSRPLGNSELSFMIQLDHETDPKEIDTTLPKKTIQSVCGNLLVYDRQLRVWRFSHLSAREYIERNHYGLIDAHLYAAMSSLRLLLKDFVWLPPGAKQRHECPLRTITYNSDDRQGPCVEHSVSSDYVIHRGLLHVREVDSSANVNGELASLLKDFFEPIAQGSSAFQAWNHIYVFHSTRGRPLEGFYRSRGWFATEYASTTPLPVMANFGLLELVEDLWKNAGDKPNMHPPNTPSPLTVAIRRRRKPVWTYLLQRGVRINDGSPRPLTVAILSDCMEAYEALLEAKPDVNDIDPHPFRLTSRTHTTPTRIDTPLKAALWGPSTPNRKRIIRELLDRGADVNLKTEYRSTLELAVKYLAEEDVKMLLDANAEAYSPDYLLRLAAQNETANLVPLFMSLGANANRPWEGISPMIWALLRGNMPNLRSLLMIPGISIDLNCQEHREAVVLASERYGCRELFPILANSGMDINWTDGEVSFLTMAITSYLMSNREFYWLINAGVNVNSILPRSALPTPLAIAATCPHLYLFETLLKAGADPNISVDSAFGSALVAAAFHGRLAHCRKLLDRDEVNVNQEQKGFFRNSLFAVIAGHRDYSLFKRRYRHSRDRWKPLGHEIYIVPGLFELTTRIIPEHVEVVKLFFEKGLNVYMPIYGFLDPWIPSTCIIMDQYEVKEPCQLYQKGQYGYLCRSWFFIMWELRNSTAPQPPFRSQLRYWQFPGALPHKFTVGAKLMSLDGDRPNYFLFLSICGHRSRLRIVPAEQGNRSSWCPQLRDRRWKKYNPEHYGVVKTTQDLNPVSEMCALISEATAAADKLQPYIVSRTGSFISWALLPLIGVLFACLVAPHVSRIAYR
ncbi:hypothetical protein NW762_009112 [Fusarium torreyae]|uniref:NACHT domain-containing protein n=1 Tax=Fusarium torreyae TaxID=1237075 RepID=A0A9W8VBE1_9HYPO|nr:hypothetical protein NW762_009112 [Fusarium torreyae]